MRLLKLLKLLPHIVFFFSQFDYLLFKAFILREELLQHDFLCFQFLCCFILRFLMEELDPS